MPSSMPRLPARPTRRTVTLGLAALPLTPAMAADFAIDWQGGPQTPDVERSLADQIALVRRLPIKPDIAAFFAAQPITVDLADGTHTRAGPRGVFFERRPVPADNPVLLHELLHRYHLLRLPDGRANTTVRQFFESVRAAGAFPAGAYMFTNPFEFFAMATSVVLHGRAARPPLTRANVAAKAPALYEWIVAEFGLRLDAVTG